MPSFFGRDLTARIFVEKHNTSFDCIPPGTLHPIDTSRFFDMPSTNTPSSEHPVLTQNNLDDYGNPAGGWVRMRGGSWISWQNGPLGAAGPDRPQANGCFVEDVLTAVIERIEFYQSTKVACDENADALKHLKIARAKLNSRTRRREKAGTEGTVHASHHFDGVGVCVDCNVCDEPSHCARSTLPCRPQHVTRFAVHERRITSLTPDTYRALCRHDRSLIDAWFERHDIDLDELKPFEVLLYPLGLATEVRYFKGIDEWDYDKVDAVTHDHLEVRKGSWGSRLVPQSMLVYDDPPPFRELNLGRGVTV